jgi:hypothetical protein
MLNSLLAVRVAALVELRAPEVDQKIAKRTQSRRQESWRNWHGAIRAMLSRWGGWHGT